MASLPCEHCISRAMDSAGIPPKRCSYSFRSRRWSRPLPKIRICLSRRIYRSRTNGTRWTILDDRYRGGLREPAAEVVLKGVERVLDHAPIGRFGKLVTVDRREIESFRSIRSLISEYMTQPRPPRPLSIAAFGPPGSGKSFGIRQLAEALRPGEIEAREFNLSQFVSNDELLSALHQVRDIGLSGKTPLIFWDEFDCSRQREKYGWLRYFLAPMQDGNSRTEILATQSGKRSLYLPGEQAKR